MKIFKCKKSALFWKSINQLSYKWELPILINTENEVILGNSLFSLLPEYIFVIVIEKNQLLEDDLLYIEQKIVEENSDKRIGIIDFEIRNYLKYLKRPRHQNECLFSDIKETGIISSENYIVRKDNFKSHGPKKEEDINNNLFPLFDIDEKEVKTKQVEIEVDLEILKELL